MCTNCSYIHNWKKIKSHTRTQYTYILINLTNSNITHNYCKYCNEDVMLNKQLLK
jgi:hypothetical protein